jgi:hypothetical protein
MSGNVLLHSCTRDIPTHTCCEQFQYTHSHPITNPSGVERRGYRACRDWAEGKPIDSGCNCNHARNAFQSSPPKLSFPVRPGETCSMRLIVVGHHLRDWSSKESTSQTERNEYLMHYWVAVFSSTGFISYSYLSYAFWPRPLMFKNLCNRYIFFLSISKFGDVRCEYQPRVRTADTGTRGHNR